MRDSLTAFRAPDELLDNLDRHANESERTRSEVIREALALYLKDKETAAA